MSKNKMGGVPDRTRDAFYDFFDNLDDDDDAKWAKVIKASPSSGLESL